MGAGVIVALLTAVVEAAVFPEDGLVVTVAVDVLVAVDEPEDAMPAVLVVLVEDEAVFEVAPEAEPDEALFDEAVPDDAVPDEPDGVIFDIWVALEDDPELPPMMPPSPVVTVETDVDVTRVVAVDRAVLLDKPAKPSVI